MRTVVLTELDQELEFAKKAAKYFAEHDRCTTYTDGAPKKGCLFAVRWGMEDDGVLVFKLSEEDEPTHYAYLIRQTGTKEKKA